MYLCDKYLFSLRRCKRLGKKTPAPCLPQKKNKKQRFETNPLNLKSFHVYKESDREREKERERERHTQSSILNNFFPRVRSDIFLHTPSLGLFLGLKGATINFKC